MNLKLLNKHPDLIQTTGDVKGFHTLLEEVFKALQKYEKKNSRFTVPVGAAFLQDYGCALAKTKKKKI